MDVIDRFRSGLFVNKLNLNTGFIPPPRPSTGIGNYPPAGQPIALPTPSLESSQETPLPLLSVSIDVDLNGRLSTTKVTQKFTNATASAAQNARYLFPIYNGSVVTSFKCWIGPDKLLEGDVKPKEAARADFEQAVSRHKAAVLVEEVTPEIFETNLGNIPAQTTVKVEIAYTGLLKVNISTGGLVLNIPTSIAPRYGSAPDEYSAADPLPTEGLRVSIHASMPAAIRKMESGTHPISVEIGAVSHRSFQTFVAGASSETFDPSKARANLADRSAALDRDFVLYITLSSPREFMQSQAVATSQPEIPGRSTVAITINPGNLFLQMVNPDDFNGEIIFMADRSGSMERNIPSLIDVMNVFLRSLPQQCSFNIASFGSSVSWLWPVSKVYNQDQLDIATQHVAAFQANLRGTEILSALQSVLDHHDKRLDVPTNVILLTDGEVWDVDQVIRFARNTASDRNLNIRFFALGIGDRVSHRLVEGIGQQGGGCAEIVAESSPGSWQGRVIQMLKAALTPHRLRCDVGIGELRPATTGTFEASKISDYKLELPPCIQAPHHIPVLNVFSQFSLYYMLECELDALPETVTVTGVTDKGEKLTAQLPLQKSGYQSGVHHLAAKALMNDYETGQSWLHAANSALRCTEPEIFDRLLEQEAQRLGQQWSITSKWTSFVAIDRDTARRHEISLWMADGVDVSELTRPRKIRPLPAFSQREILSLSPSLHNSIPPTQLKTSPEGRNLQRHYSRTIGLSFEACQGKEQRFDKPISQEPANRTGSETYLNLFGDSGCPGGSDPATRSIPAEHYYGQRGRPRGAYAPDGANAHGASRHCYGAEPQCSSSAVDILSKSPPHTMPKSSQDLQKKDSNGEISAECPDEVQSYSSINPSMLSQSAADSLDFWTTSQALPNSKKSRLRTLKCAVALEDDDTSVPSTACSSQGGDWSASNVMTSKSKESCETNTVCGSPSMTWGSETQMMGGWVGSVSEEKSPRATPMTLEDPTNILSLSGILYSQGADGEFRLYGTNIQRPLIAEFKTVIHFANRSAVSNQHHELHSIDLNVLAVVYITTRHAMLKGLWELQVAKARRWIQQQLAELSRGESNPPGQESPQMALEKLERMARVELLDDSEVSDNI
ncbi:hypothetical protein PENNAL_c0127G05275 [Penicillium nalgiovense]|uniref:VIT domain-containing protein n=1 Tax=Penicillium nalgiovense TaxID=60175 RepID=A0A1V6X448_PENNA|nr:hypothetical protein PENNAL_c0127G05275 [Penicillium nalgiovense]